MAPHSVSRAVRSPRNLIEAELVERLHLRSDLHLARKAWHMIMGMVIAFTYSFICKQSTAILILGSCLGLDLLIETARLKVPAFNQKFIRHCGLLLRSCEANRFTGTPFYIASSLLSVAIFPKPIAVLSVLLLAVGDPIASLIGVLFGKNSYRFSSGKSLIGTGAGVVSCFLVSLVFYRSFQNFSPLQYWGLSMISGFIGGVAELLPFDLDDNFVIPIVSGFVTWAAFIALGV